MKIKKSIAYTLSALVLFSYIPGPVFAESEVSNPSAPVEATAEQGEVQVGNFKFNPQTRTITDYTGEYGINVDLVIPGSFEVNGKEVPVEGIGQKRDKWGQKIAIFRSRSLKSIQLPSSLKTIGDNVFFDLHIKEKLILPKGLTEIGSRSFESCFLEKGLFLPQSLQNIKPDAFAGTRVNGNVRVPSGIEVIGERAFSHLTISGDLIVSPGVKQVERYAFLGVRSFKLIFEGENTEFVGNHIFSNGIFKEIQLPKQLTEIPVGIFANCIIQGGDGKLVIPETVRKINSAAFSEADLAKVVFTSGQTQLAGPDIFARSRIKEIILKEGLTEIPFNTFEKCKELKEIRLPSTVRRIERNAFANILNCTIYVPGEERADFPPKDSYTEGTKIVYEKGPGSKNPGEEPKNPDKEKVKAQELLKSSIVYMESIDQDAYPKEALQNFLKILNEAKKVLESAQATREDLDVARQNLLQGRKVLEKQRLSNSQIERTKAEKALRNLINELNGLKKEAYTKSAWEDFVKVLDKAKEVYINDNSSTKDIDVAYFALGNAKKELDKNRLILTDFERQENRLRDLVEKVRKLEEKNYSKETWKDLKYALDDAKDELNYSKRTERSLERAYDKLNKAYKDLKLANKLAEEAEKINQDHKVLVRNSSYQNMTDIKSHWARDFIKYCMDRGYLVGTSITNFSPDRPTTRAEFVTVLSRLAGIKEENYKQNKFTDVPKGVYYEAAVNWAQDKKIVEGIGNNKFAPDQTMTREEMATILDRYFQAIKKDYGTRGALYFQDQGDISLWAADSVKRMTQTGILHGTDRNTFEPKSSFTRAELATVIYQLNR